MRRPLCIDLYAGLGGWAEGFLAEGYQVVGFDTVRHNYGPGEQYPAQLVLQDVTTIHGRQFKDAAIIVASPPCQAYSYRAMPWTRAKALPPPDNTLFETCFRIQREASAAAGRHIPLIVENVRGAQLWVGRARFHYGSYYLWGDIPALMPSDRCVKVGDLGWQLARGGVKPDGYKGGSFTDTAIKNLGYTVSAPTARGRWRGNAFPHEITRAATRDDGVKVGGDWFGVGNNKSLARMYSSGSSKRKRATAIISKIPLPLARYIATTFKPKEDR